jgi:hypothetical protein
MKMTKEQRESNGAKIKATVALNRKKWDSQTIVVDENWKVHRCDQFNWEIRYREEFSGYYGRLTSALEALLPKMLGEESPGGSIASLLELGRDIKRRIIQSLPDTLPTP